MTLKEKFLKFRVANVDNMKTVCEEVNDPSLNSKIVLNELHDEYESKRKHLKSLEKQLESIILLRKQK